MNRKILSVIVSAMVVVIILVIVIDFSGNRPEKKSGNPYQYDIREYREVDEAMVHYREVRNIPLEGYKAGGIDISGSIAWLTGEGFLLGMTHKGEVQVKKEIEGNATCIEVSDDAIYLGFEKHVEKYDLRGNHLATWESPGERTVITSLSQKEQTLFVADAGNRRVIRYDPGGNVIGQFRGKAEENALGHGFIVPSASFDLVVNGFGELWVVNPGMHAIENYTDEGEMRGYWQKMSMELDGFTGCCNPAEIDVLEDGSFVTSEKGLVRIKVYDPSGQLISVVAPPEKFKEETKAPEVKVDSEGKIWALDFERNTIRVFKKI